MVYFSRLRRYRSFRLMFRLRLARRILPVGQLKWAFTEAHSFASDDLASIDGVLGHGFEFPPLRQLVPLLHEPPMAIRNHSAVGRIVGFSLNWKDGPNDRDEYIAKAAFLIRRGRWFKSTQAHH
jgi:hypothetical protein